MKKLLLLITALSALTVSAQTNSTGFLPDLGKVGSDIGSFLTDANGQTNWGVTLGGIYSDKQFGLFGDAQYSLSSISSVGFLTAYIPHAYQKSNGKWGGTFYDGSLGFKLGSSIKIPVIGTIYYYGESGPGYDFSSHQTIAQSFAGLTKDIFISHKYHLVLGGGVGNISDRAGMAYIAHATFIW